ncbi:MAG: phosphoadenylyl-sulfate reductase [Acidobacteria bacterium]|nr:phosphoadenylyl-sulfate reductase [Acidobacteriota bacterium]
MPTTLDQHSIPALNKEWEALSAQEVVGRALELFHPRMSLASSFGAEDVVLIDMLRKANAEARVFTLDTGRLNQETYDVIDAIRERYGLRVEAYFPQRDSVEEMEREHGVNLFYRAIDLRKLCCNVRKVEPLGRALEELDAWMTGLRRDQTAVRATVGKVEWDAAHNMVKVNPLLDWNWDDVLKYIRDQNVPYNTLHDRGFPSIGCAPCTRPIKPGEDLRAGRWWWEAEAGAKECGLHVR